MLCNTAPPSVVNGSYNASYNASTFSYNTEAAYTCSQGWEVLGVRALRSCNHQILNKNCIICYLPQYLPCYLPCTYHTGITLVRQWLCVVRPGPGALLLPAVQVLPCLPCHIMFTMPYHVMLTLSYHAYHLTVYTCTILGMYLHCNQYHLQCFVSAYLVRLTVNYSSLP